MKNKNRPKNRGFLKFKDLETDGEHLKHENWARIKTMSFSINQSHNHNYPHSRDDSYKYTNFSHITVTRYPDEASFQFMSFVDAHSVGEMVIEFEGDAHYAEKNDYPPRSGYLFKLKDATILIFSITLDDDGNNLERIEIGFNKLNSSYCPFNVEGKMDSPWMFEYSNQEK